MGEGARGSSPNDVGTDTSLVDSVNPVGAPARWLAFAGACVAASFVLVAPPERHPVLWVLGWATGGFASVGLLAVFTMKDSRRRADAWYITRPVFTHARTVLIMFAAVAVALNAWRFADWVSRR